MDEGEKIKKLFISEPTARRFFTNKHYSFKAKCPNCGNDAEIHRADLTDDDPPLDETSVRDVGYPTLGRCPVCGKALIVGYKD